MEKLVIGIDVSKEKLDLCLFDGVSVLEHCIIDNSLCALESYLSHILESTSCSVSDLLLCAEYTGHYIYPLCLLSQKGYRVWIENPSQIKYSSGVSRGKNDKTDALKIAKYAFRYQDRKQLFALGDEAITKLKELVGERDLYVVDRAKYLAQIKDQSKFMAADNYASKKARLEVIVGTLDDLIDEIEQKIIQTIQANELLQHQYELLLSTPGVGPRVATKMIIETGAFADFKNGRKFCAHAGVAPFEHTSGSSLKIRSRVSHKADKSIKKLLHLAAMAAIRTKGEIREYYQRKIGEGKAKMSVINAVRAKMVLIMFAIIRNNKPYEKNYKFSFV